MKTKNEQYELLKYEKAIQERENKKWLTISVWILSIGIVLSISILSYVTVKVKHDQTKILLKSLSDSYQNK